MRKGKDILAAVSMLLLLLHVSTATCQELFFDNFTVSVCTDSPVLVGMQDPYNFIQNGYDSIAPGSNETIYIQGLEFGENLVLDRDAVVILQGGYDCFFSEPPDSFSIVNSMTITGGTVIAENIILRDITGQLYSTLPDTGQQTSLTDTFGEDHDYSINPPSYTLNGDGTTRDNVTGLMWQSSDDDMIYNWYEASGTPEATYNPGGAVNVCGDLSLAGFDDWRLPNVIELQGIINYDNNAPSIDMTYFPGTTNHGYWTANTHALYADEAWLVDFDFPFYPYGSVSYDSKISSLGYKVRCVRGGQVAQTLIDNGDGTITDMASGLTWQQEDDSVVRTWEEALTYCESLELPPGQADWRLPNIKELGSIVNNTTHSPAIDLNFFPDTSLGDYWSSTHGWTYSHHNGVYTPSGAWSISFSIVNEVTHDDGYINKSPTTSYTYARCVRDG